jgi:hypothetical protein
MRKGTKIRFPRWRRGDTHKHCGACGERKPLTEFHRRKKSDPCVPAAYCKSCNEIKSLHWAKEFKERHNENVRGWNARNPERAAASRRKAFEADPERFRQASRTHYWRYPEKRRASRKEAYHANRDAERRKYREWRLKNPALNAHKAMMYEARKRRAMPAWADRKKILAVYEACAALNRAAGFTKYHVDHVYPLCSEVMCGLHVHENLRVILAVENQRKSNRILDIDDAGSHLCGDRC